MSIEIARRKFDELVSGASGLVTDAGRLFAHTLFPNDFEYYLFAFELIDGDSGKVTDRFVFPVNPSSESIDKNNIIGIQKSHTGITSYVNNSFVPKPISISGTFGRKFKLMSFNKRTTTSSEVKGISDVVADFIPDIKTGYGAIKSMERILEKSRQETEKGSPYYLLFYNLSFNQAYVVEYTNLNVSQTIDNNMMWNYSLNMTAVADAYSVSTFKDRLVNSGVLVSSMGHIDKVLNSTSEQITKWL